MKNLLGIFLISGCVLACGGSDDEPNNAGGSDLGPAGSVCGSGKSYSSPLANSPTPTALASNLGFLEGPVWVDPAGSEPGVLYFSHFTGSGNNGRIRKYQPSTGEQTVFVEGVGTNGLAVDEKGQIIAAFHEGQTLVRFDPESGQRSAVAGADGYMGTPFNSVNDIVVRGDGHIYFTDPTYQQGNRDGQDQNGYYHLTPAGQLTRIGTQDEPNGIVLSPDGRFLYVSGTGNPRSLQRHAVAADGSVDPTPTTLSSAPSDGMAIDCAGNLYLTTGAGNNGGNVTILSPDGTTIGRIDGFSSGTTNAAFGGPDRTTLFVTTSSSLFQVELAVPGLPN